ncbi:MAG: YceD family protein [Bacteroidales bacterium]
MNPLKPYHIPFKGLSLGHHGYDFEIGHDFFESFEQSELQEGKVHVHLDLEKQERMLILDFGFNGEVEVVCDRCAYEYMQPIHGRQTVYVKFGEEEDEGSEDDIVFIPENAWEVDVSQIIYDYINILLPMQRIHPNDADGNPGCNAEMLRLLDELKPPAETDPRWNALKGLLDNEN